MASSTAQIAKNKGNSSFKSGNWADAVGHYSAAILTDHKEPTYPLNRAAAYLKLGKYRDAERDCTTVLSLDGKNVKALFRRAQSRAALEIFGEAEKDLLEALKIEPANASIKSELASVQRQQLEISQKRSNKREPISLPPTLSSSQSNRTSKVGTSTISPRRITRNVPIEIIEPVELESSDDPKVDYSHALSPSTSSHSPTSSASKPKPQPHVGAGIFRADGSHTIIRSPTIETNRSSSSTPLSPPASPQLKNSISAAPMALDATVKTNDIVLPTPLTHFALTRAWNALPTPHERFCLITRISPESFPVLFQSSLEPEFLVSMLHTFKAVASPSTSRELSMLMCTLPSIPRFNTILLFLTPKEKALVKAVWDAIDATQSCNGRYKWGL